MHGYKHTYPFWLRLWHWFNALLFLTLIATGLSMQYSNQNFQPISFKNAVNIHNIAGILLTAAYLFFLAGNILSGNNRFYGFNKKEIKDQVIKQLNYYVSGIFKKQQAPYPATESEKFNPLQKPATC
ncbi:MAG: hypothetical protein HC896_04525 [Bacteroidales bacterium]|nr:hypothetical protein [Bacteroidales bacterium]